MYCKFCGSKNAESYIFCTTCGNKIGADTTDQNNAPTQTVVNYLGSTEDATSLNSFAHPVVDQCASYNEGYENYSFFALSSNSNRQSRHKYWIQKRESVSIPTTWMDVYVRILMLLSLFASPLSLLSTIYNTIQTSYDGDALMYFSQPINNIMIAFFIASYIMLLLARMNLMRFNPIGLRFLWILITIQILSAMFFFILFWSLNVTDHILQLAIPALVRIFIISIPSLIYFEKRRFMYYQKSVYNRYNLEIDKNHKLGIIVLFAISILLLLLVIVFTIFMRSV